MRYHHAMRRALLGLALGLALPLGFAAGCGARTPTAAGHSSSTSACTSEPPSCVVSGDDPCGPPRVVTPACDAGTHAWGSCPAPSVARVANPTGVCRPLHDGAIASLGGSLVRIPTEDGRCLWVGEDVTLKGDSPKHNVAFDVTTDTLRGDCPWSAESLGEIVELATPDPSLFVQLDSAHRFAGQVRVLYRLFRREANAPFGLVDLGGGIAHWNASGTRLVVPGVAGLLWGPDLSLGDASLADATYLYAWGCPPPIDFLTEKCLLARFDGAETMELFEGKGQWSKGTAQANAARLFDAGPWLSSVLARPSGFLHVYAAGFAKALEMHGAPALEGPWSTTGTRSACDLPTTDKDAFCAGPVVHEELMNSARPGQLPVTYGVGTTSPNGVALRAQSPDDYWPRLVWITAP